MEFIIRPAESQEDLLNYYHACFPLFKEKFYVGSTDSDEDLFEKHREDLSKVDFFDFDVMLFVAQDYENVFCGAIWVGLREENDTWDKADEEMAWVYDVEVLQEFRGYGLGRRLMIRVEDWARARGLGRIGLHTDYLLDVARKLYLSLGYKDFAYVLRKPVSKSGIEPPTNLTPMPPQSKRILGSYYKWRAQRFSSIVGVSNDSEQSEIQSLYPKFSPRPDLMDSSYATYVIGDEDTTLLGLVFGKEYDGAAWILDLEINPDFDWDQGALPLLRQMEIWAKSQHLTTMAIFIHAKREELIQALRKVGYEFTDFFMHKYLS